MSSSEVGEASAEVQQTEPMSVDATSDEGKNGDVPATADEKKNENDPVTADDEKSGDDPVAIDDEESGDDPAASNVIESSSGSHSEEPESNKKEPTENALFSSQQTSEHPKLIGDSDLQESMHECVRPKNNSSENTFVMTPPVVIPMPPPVQLPTPLAPHRRPRGRPTLASQTPRFPGPPGEFYKALVDMHTCLKWDRPVLYKRYERSSSTLNRLQNGDGIRSNQTPYEENLQSEDSDGLILDPDVKEEPVVCEPDLAMMEDGNEDEENEEENNVVIGSSFSLSNPDDQPQTDKGQPSPGNQESSNTSSITTYYIFGLDRLSGRRCVVPDCEKPLDPHFSFPKDKNLCLKWLLAIPKGNWSLNEQSVVCSRHFPRTNINWRNRTNVVTLIADTVPSLCLSGKPMFSKPSLPRKCAETDKSSSAVPSASKPVAGISDSLDVGLIQKSDGVFKIQMNDDCDSGSDLEIIEPHIETYEVSDTSDEGESPENKASKGDTSTANHKNLPISIVGVNSPKEVSSSGQLISRQNDGTIIRCCVPRCNSYTGNPAGVGFHTFPNAGETRLSVRSLTDKVTVHDLCSMWKSLLSVPNVTADSYVCTRHFTVNDYVYNTLNKSAVPTQFLPTPVMFAPCRVENSSAPPPLIILKNQPRMQNNRSLSNIRIRAPAILRGVSRFSSPSSKNQPVRLPHQLLTLPSTAPSVISAIDKVVSSNHPLNLGNYRPLSIKVGCSIPDCSNRTYRDGNKPSFFRLPSGIDKCKEWVYSCGHPEWLDKGMVFARAKVRICSKHFSDDMFLGCDHKMLKGHAKPCVNVQRLYKKCIVNSCHNYYDKERLHHIGVDFAPFPDRNNVFRLKKWIQAVKCSEGDPTEEDLTKYETAVICSLHFRNSDYVAGPVGKRLSRTAVPSMNLFVKAPNLPTDEHKEDLNPKETGTSKIREEKRSPLPTKRNKRGINAGLLKWREEQRLRKAAREKALAEEQAQELKGDGEAQRSENEAAREDRVAGRTEDESHAQSVDNDNEVMSPSRRRGRGRGRSRGRGRGRGRSRGSRSLVGDSEEAYSKDSSEDELIPSENDSSSGSKGRPLCKTRSSSLKRHKNSDCEEVESEGDTRRRRKRSRLYDEVVVPVTRASARAATAKNKRIYAEDSGSDDRRDDNDQGFPDGDNDPQKEVKRSEGSPSRDPNALDVAMDTLESCLKTSEDGAGDNDDSLGMPDLGLPNQPEASEDITHTSTNNDNLKRRSNVPEPEETDNEQSNQNEADEPVGRTLRFGRKTSLTPQKSKNNRRKSRGRSGIPEDSDQSSTTPELPLLSVRTEGDITMSTERDDPAKNSSNSSGATESLKPPNDVPPSNDTPPDSDNTGIPGDQSNSIPNDEKNQNNVDTDDDNSVPYGPKEPAPTPADLDFFRSLIPTMTKFNPHQRAILRATVLSTLKSMLGDDIDMKISSTDQLLSELPLPCCPD